MLMRGVLIKALLIAIICQNLAILQPSRKRVNSPKLQSANSGVVKRPFGHANTYEVPLAATHPSAISISSEQAAVATASLKSDIVQEPGKFITGKRQQAPPFVNIKNNSTEETSRLSNNNQGEYLKENDDEQKQHFPSTAEFPTALEQQQQQPPSSPNTLTSHAIRYFHDIFLNYPKPHHANVGHTEFSPGLFVKRFASQKAGNRYRGEILWLDNMGGFAQHSWDLAQGRL